jgi:hypothetical protein
MLKTEMWTEPRLQLLFARYNRRFWRGLLPSVRARIAKLVDCYGEWDEERGEIRIDINRHPNDREVRSTLLHEMIHVVAGEGHGSKFWFQIERLLRQKAPVTISFPETGGLENFKDAVPSRFPFARRALNAAHERQLRDREKAARTDRESGFDDVIMTDQDVAREFGECDAAALPWKRALWIVGSNFGLLDVDRRPKNRWAANIIEQGRKIHRQARREVLETRRIKTEFSAQGLPIS